MMLIILFVFVFAPLSIGMVALGWKLSNNAQRQRILDTQAHIVRRVKTKILPQEKPFGELRMPMMFAALSTTFLILLTGMFGISYNTITGEVLFHMDPGDDWDGNYDPYEQSDWRERSVMNQFGPMWALFVPLFHMFAVLGVAYGWFEYQKWKWKHYAE